MRPRQQITDMFSTFVQLQGDRFSKWLTDTRLRLSIQNCLQHFPETYNSENFLTLYWHKHWQNQSTSLAKMHLSAYLQEQFYWAAQATVAKLTSSQYSLADCFQLANAEVESILKEFNPNISNNLKAYASMAILSRLRDILRQRREADFCTDWSLLRKVSKKQLLAALNQAGLSPVSIAQYRLAWTCFKQLYVHNQPGGTGKLAEPSHQVWEAIANLYNSERQSQLTQATKQCNADTIKQWLTQTAMSVRTYLYPPVISLNITKDDTNIMLDLPDPSSDSLIAELIAEEDARNRANQQNQINNVLSNALQLLDAQSQELLKLYYQQGQTQLQIVQHLRLSQPTVSRRLVKARESLLAALIKWSQETVNISVTSNQIKDLSTALEEWLKNHLIVNYEL
ncbi:MAG: sigma-70 family RNA polymerase sigma factor [Fischerella sp.]|jgi:RNA polymerase sigma factor (sigma-70 family)|uniref:sigma-70 family RNA polymerase sigma factor n=1 Tax=Fischerella sp. TaxID=1191 RepID=UPI0018464D2C|nr:sigma-70 family RNA polymerase sigma factor [Fischerella sp.]NWF60507.1 sigma-70 family RNA polymerase sigma factor [Fischerella sp.]